MYVRVRLNFISFQEEDYDGRFEARRRVWMPSVSEAGDGRTRAGQASPMRHDFSGGSGDFDDRLPQQQYASYQQQLTSGGPLRRGAGRGRARRGAY